MNGITEDYAIEADQLTRCFGSLYAVESVTLRISRGCVSAILGLNGSGKSTLIKIMAGHLRPTRGSVRILGLNYGENLLDLRRRVGYVSENRPLYDWMTVGEKIRFTRSFYPNWDDNKAALLLMRFGLHPDETIGRLSRGNRARLCLLLALSFNPEVILLDEPTSGLDPVARRDFLENMISEIARFGRTIVFSTHLAEEAERIADDVAILHQGRLLTVSKVEDLKASFKKVRLDALATPSNIPNLVAVENRGKERILTVKDWNDETARQLNGEVLPMTLEEIFVNTVRYGEMKKI